MGEPVTLDHKHRRQPCPRRVVKCQHICWRRRQALARPMEVKEHQWTLIGNGWKGDATDAARRDISNKTALMAPR